MINYNNLKLKTQTNWLRVICFVKTENKRRDKAISKIFREVGGKKLQDNVYTILCPSSDIASKKVLNIKKAIKKAGIRMYMQTMVVNEKEFSESKLFISHVDEAE